MISFLLVATLAAFFGYVSAQTRSEEGAQDHPVTIAGTPQGGRMDSLYAGMHRGYLTLEHIFQGGCYDCHTNKTRYPWYYKLPVVKGMIDQDIRRAKKQLNMSNGFPFDSVAKTLADDFVAIRGELQESTMPPLTYRMMHWSAKPSQAEKDSIYAWIKESLDSLAAHGIVPTQEGEQGDEGM